MTEDEKRELALRIGKNALQDVETLTVVEMADEYGYPEPDEVEIIEIGRMLFNATITLPEEDGG